MLGEASWHYLAECRWGSDLFEIGFGWHIEKAKGTSSVVLRKSVL